MAERMRCLWRLLQDEPAMAQAESLPPADPLNQVVFSLIAALAVEKERQIPSASAQPRVLDGAPINLRGLSFTAQLWQGLDLSRVPTLDVRGANLRGLMARRCCFGQVLCDQETNWAQAVLRDCATERIEWGASRRHGLLVRSANQPRARDGMRLPGRWCMPARFGPITSVAFSADGARIVTGSYDGTARVWDGATGRELLVIKGHSDVVTSVVFMLPLQLVLVSLGQSFRNILLPFDALHLYIQLGVMLISGLALLALKPLTRRLLSHERKQP